MFKLFVDERVLPLTPRKKNANEIAPLGYTNVFSATGSFGNVSLFFYPASDTSITFVRYELTGPHRISIGHDPISAELVLNLTGPNVPGWNFGTIGILSPHQFLLLNDWGRNWQSDFHRPGLYEICFSQVPITDLRKSVATAPAVTRLFAHACCRTQFAYPAYPCSGEMLDQWKKMSTLLVNDYDRNPIRQSIAARTLFLLAFSQAARQQSITVESAPRKIRMAAGRINLNPELHHTIPSLSSYAGISSTGLKQGFQQVFGKTVLEYITEKRLELAVRLLMTTRLNEDVIAMKSGYHGSDTLIKLFKKEFGGTPRQLRTAYERRF